MSIKLSESLQFGPFPSLLPKASQSIRYCDTHCLALFEGQQMTGVTSSQHLISCSLLITNADKERVFVPDTFKSRSELLISLPSITATLGA